MKVEELALAGATLITPKVFHDDRGFFFESHRQDVYQNIAPPLVQDNHSYSKRGVIRGMHFQTYPGQAKLVRVAVGEIYDVIVDIRPQSPTFGQWIGVTLDDRLHQQLLVPVGFAHGFCVVSEEAHVLYKTSSLFNPATQEGFRFDDPDLGIDWPVSHPIVSDQDLQYPKFSEITWT